MADEFRAMQPITLGVQRGNGEYDFYPSLILDFEPGRLVKAGVPSEHGREILVRPNTPVVIDLAAGPAVMRYHARVLERTEAPLALSIEWPTASERVQRRNHFRVEIRFPVELRVKGRPGPWEEGSTLDLSAGGVRLRLTEALPEGTMLALKLLLPSETVLEATGRVVRSGEISGATDEDRFWNGVVFVDTTERLRKEITRYVMDVQREQIRKGILG